MKKFYKAAEAGTAPGGHVVRLDGKLLKTPLRNNLILSSPELAAAIAAEWAAQGADIIPATMPLTQLVNTMIDKASGAERAALEKEILKYAASDLVCYFATHPASLVAAQEKEWLPLLGFIKEKYGAELAVVSGIQYQNQPEPALKNIEKAVRGFDSAGFTVVQAAAGVTGSVVIALALAEGKIDAETAYRASCVDEIHQLAHWGADDLAQKRLDHIRKELQAIERFKNLVAG